MTAASIEATMRAMRDLRDVGCYERQLRHLFADRLQALVDAGVSVELLATASGVEDATVQDWIMQRALPATSAAIRLSEQLRLSLDWLVGRDDGEVQVVHGGSR